MTTSPSAVIANKGVPVLVDCNEEGMIDSDLIENITNEQSSYACSIKRQNM